MKLLMILSILFASSAVFAEGAPKEVVLSEKTVMLRIELNSATVKMSDKGYSQVLLKVLVPDLADVTVLNHRNEGESAPCLATFTFNKYPEDLIQGKPGVETLPFKIKLVKTLARDTTAGKCLVSMSEHVDGMIRGFKFTHVRSTAVTPRPLEDCR